MKGKEWTFVWFERIAKLGVVLGWGEQGAPNQ